MLQRSTQRYAQRIRGGGADESHFHAWVSTCIDTEFRRHSGRIARWIEHGYSSGLSPLPQEAPDFAAAAEYACAPGKRSKSVPNEDKPAHHVACTVKARTAVGWTQRQGHPTVAIKGRGLSPRGRKITLTLSPSWAPWRRGPRAAQAASPQRRPLRGRGPQAPLAPWAARSPRQPQPPP